MLDWLKNITKEQPEFWKEYLAKFDKKSNPKRYVAIRTDYSGLNLDKDVIYAISCISVINNSIIINDSFEVILMQYKYLHDNQLSNEFIIQSNQDKMSEAQALEAFVNFIGNAILVGHRIHHEVDLLNKALEKLNCGRLKNEAIDIEIMCQKWNNTIDKPYTIDDLYALFELQKSEIHATSEEAYKIALLFLKLKSRLGIEL